MTTAITYEGVVTRAEPLDRGGQSDHASTLFAGLKLWFSSTVPQKQWLMQIAQSNGAIITNLDTQADMIIFDHARKNVPPGAYSYRYVELSVRNGALEDRDAHRISSTSRVERPVGSVRTASKQTRSSFTDLEDQILWNWIRPYMEAGGMWKGNEIYKQLETIHPRHTYQSWRDRWIKHTQFQNRRVVDIASMGQTNSDVTEERGAKRRKLQEGDEQSNQTPAQAAQGVRRRTTEAEKPATTSDDQEEPASDVPEQKPEQLRPSNDAFPLTHNFTQRDARLLFEATAQILNTEADMLDKCWDDVAEAYPSHSKEAWRTYFEKIILPEYRKRNGLDTTEQLRAHLHVKALSQQRSQRQSEEAQLELGPGIKREDVEAEHATSAIAPPQFCTAIQGVDKDTGEVTQSQDPSPSSELIKDEEISEERDAQSGLPSRSQQKPLQPQNKDEGLNSSSNASLSDIPYRPESVGNEVQISGSDRVLPEVEVDTLKSLDSAMLKTQLPSMSSLEQTSQNWKQTLPHVGPTSQSSSVVKVTSETPAVDTQNSSNNMLFTLVSTSDQKRALLRESPLFFPDDADSSPDDELGPNGQKVQLVDDDDSLRLESVDLHSQHTPSEAGSEYFDAEAGPELSNAWETAPENGGNVYPPILLDDVAMTDDGTVDSHRDHHERNVRDEDDGSVTPVGTQTQNLRFETAPNGYPQMVHEIDDIDDMESIQPTEFETAQDKFNIAPPTGDGANDEPDNPDDGLFAIPPPEGGWSDIDDEDEDRIDGNIALGVRKQKSNGKSESQQEQRQSKSRANTKSAVSKPSSQEEDIDTWLVSIQERHPNIDSLILDEFCIKGLETTSLQLEITSKVVEEMISTFEKNKHTALRHLTGLFDNNKTTKRIIKSRRKSRSTRVAISKMVDEMIPTNQAGVWTKEDDRKLMGTNARDVQSVERKHGTNGVRSRFEYLEQLYKDE